MFNKKWDSLFFLYPKIIVELLEYADEDMITKIE